ncbi:MAG: trimeric autotransporter adhesin [Mucilaginibacter sp.]|nr:trimeric autotransporter adhesin [Mucilaginibacter sp.]
MKKNLHRTFSIFILLILFVSSAYGNAKVTAISVGTQTGTATYSTGTSVTYTIALTRGNLGATGSDVISISSWSSGLPTGVTIAFSPSSPYNPNVNASVTLTLTTTAATPVGSYTFTVTNIDANGGGTTTSTGILTVNPTTPAISGAGTVCAGSAITLTGSGGSPSGGTYNWYNVAAGGSSLFTGSTYTPTTSGTYYVSYTYSTVVSSRSAGGVATINSAPVLSTVPTTPASGLYLSYPFSGNANDVSGNNNNGTIRGAPSLTSDRYNAINSAYNFNGTSQYITTAKSNPSPGPQNFSISVWFKTSSAGGLLVGFADAQTGSTAQYDRHIYMNNSGQIYFGLYPGTFQTINSTTTYADGNWHHVVATESTTNGANLFVDGTLQASDATMTTSQDYGGSGYWRMGYNSLSGWPSAPSNTYFSGSLDDIAIYNTELTAYQVYALYGAGSVPVCVGSAMTLQANTVGGATYSWTGPNGFSSTSQNPTVSSSATTTNSGIYVLTVTGSNGCTSTINVTGYVSPLPVSTFTASSPVAVNGNSTITYTGTYDATSTYTWNFNGGTVMSGSGVGPYTVKWGTSGSKTVTLTVTSSGGCTSTSTQTVFVNIGNYSTYAYGMPLTLNTTGLGITSDLSNFPFLVTITDPSLVYTSGSCSNKVQYPNGPAYDFAFVDAGSGSEVPYQVESYNQTTGTLLVWVKIPTLTHSTNNAIYFYYGSASTPGSHTTAFYQSTWASDYKAVYHFNESAFTGSVTDATANGHTGTTAGMTSSDLISGKVGNAYSFDGLTKKITANAVTINGSFTISAWVNVSSLSHDQKIMTNQATAGGSTGGYKLGVYSNNIPESESGVAVNRGSTPLAPALSSSTWYYLQSVYSGSQLTTYVNGVKYQALSTNNDPSSTNPLYIGVGEGGSQLYFYGTIDEARVSNIAKTSDWLLAEYNNQNNPANFTTAGGITTNFTNASAIAGGINYSTADGVNYTYTINSVSTSGTPPNNGTASLNITGTNAVISIPSTIYGLTVNASDKIDLNGQTLNVGCNIVNNGTITNSSSTASTLNLNGASSTQTYTGTSSSVAQFDNVTVNNSAAGTVTITGGAVSIYKSLTLTKGNLFVDNTNSGALTLKSTSTQTAGVAAIPAAYAITGNVTVERYLTGGSGYRTYRFISSPVYAATVSSNNVYSLNYLQNSVYLTGNTGGGFDKTGNPTIYLFREDLTPSNSTFTSGNFWGISAINNTPSYNYYLNGGATAYNIPVGNGFLFFFRGNKASASLGTETTSSYVPGTVTLSTTGTLNQGPVTVHSWYTPGSANIAYTGTGTGTNYTVRGFNLVGNPYASSIDWSTFSSSTSTAPIYGKSVNPTIWQFDPATKNYATYNAATNIATGNGGKIIASGQAFFVQANALSPMLTFQESAKSSAQVTGSNLLMGTPASQTAYNSYLRLKLVTDTINYNDMVIGFNSSSDAKFNPAEDSEFLAGLGAQESLFATSSDKIRVAAKWLPLPKNKLSQVVKLNVSAAATGLYTLERTDFKEIPALYEVWLMDSYKKDSLDIRNNTTYVFNLNLKDTASYGSNRFRVVIRENPALGVHLLNFTATKATAGSQIAWKTENEANYTNFTVERSTDNGMNFNVLNGISSSNQGTYSYLDAAPVNGANQYRLKLEDLNGTVTYSNVIIIMYGNVNSTGYNAINIYPNPVNSMLNVAINPAAASGSATPANNIYGIIIVNNTGAVIKNVTTTQQNWQTDVGSLIPGTYIIQVLNNSDNSLVAKGTFVKL